VKVVDRKGVIVCGHTRWKAAQRLGLEKVPVHVAKDLTPEQIRAYRIADNKLHELSEWNLDLLPIELAELQALDVDLSLLGFDADELAQLLGGDVTPGLTDPDDIPEPPDAAITQPGDLWVLGNHRLLCGDSSGVADDRGGPSFSRLSLYVTERIVALCLQDQVALVFRLQPDDEVRDVVVRLSVVEVRNRKIEPCVLYEAANAGMRVDAIGRRLFPDLRVRHDGVDMAAADIANVAAGPKVHLGR